MFDVAWLSVRLWVIGFDAVYRRLWAFQIFHRLSQPYHLIPQISEVTFPRYILARVENLGIVQPPIRVGDLLDWDAGKTFRATLKV